ncbi:hypothetical protein F4815DRAFT_445022 [Daldinia loculata]|nr:hypothetical protein F4815DRAFT_445022 [Daldinia loculata]
MDIKAILEAIPVSSKPMEEAKVFTFFTMDQSSPFHGHRLSTDIAVMRTNTISLSHNQDHVTRRMWSTLQTVLGLPVDGFKPDSLGNEAGRREALSNLADVPFADGTSVTVPEPAIPIPRGLGRQEFDVLDAIFIAIDFEYSHYSPKSGRIRLREHYRTVTDTRKFIFGQTIDILQDELVAVLKRLLYIENNTLGEIRDLILVGHGFGFEIKAMKGLGIDLTLAPSVIEIFDTEFLGYEVFGRDFKCSLSKVTKEIGILGESFHNAGNDANFTLRAMLLLAIHRYDPSKLDRAQKEKIEMYKKLAKF